MVRMTNVVCGKDRPEGCGWEVAWREGVKVDEVVFIKVVKEGDVGTET
jgi:hypothetical protein